MTEPLVSVTMRTRNRAGYLKAAVGSVLSQTYQNWELMISDDASTDETPALGKTWEQSDPRIQYIRHDPALGASSNWRFCLAHSRGKYFAALDDDNRYLPTFLKKAVATLEASPSVSFVFADEWRINAAGEREIQLTEVASSHYQRASLLSGVCEEPVILGLQQASSINAALFNREILIRSGGFREIAGDFADFDVFLNLVALGNTCAYISERLVEYRQHGDQDGDTYLRSVEKARFLLSILSSVSFSGNAEQVRLSKLAQAYVTLGRTLLLHGEIDSAREAIDAALMSQPKNLRARIIAILLQMPKPVIQYGIGYRYGKPA